MQFESYQKYIIGYAIFISLFSLPILKDTNLSQNNSSSYKVKIKTKAFDNWAVSDQEIGSINLKNALISFDLNKEIIVGVIDTGIDHKHPYIKDNLVTLTGQFNQNNYGIEFNNGIQSSTPFDFNGHGTHVSGIIKSVFNQVKILPIKYYHKNNSGSTNLKDSFRALEYAINHNVDIINYSGGGPIGSKLEFELLKKAEKKGILVIVSAGNENSNIDIMKNYHFPANYGLSNLIVVGSHNQKGILNKHSNWGNNVHISAPGYKITSALPFNKKGNLNGTSQATAFVSGVASLIKAKYPHFSYKEIKNIILQSATKYNVKGTYVKYGRLNAGEAMDLALKYQVDKIVKKSYRSIASDKK